MSFSFPSVAPRWVAGIIFVFWGNHLLLGGPYSKSSNDPTNAYDAPVPGFVGADGEGNARLADGNGGFQNPDNYVNPLFYDWVQSVPVYAPSTGVATTWQITSKLLGSVTGDNFDVISLGDLSAAQISSSVSPGSATLAFTRLVSNLDGADFVVFENTFTSSGGAGVSGQAFADLGYVEASSDGQTFARFPSRSLTSTLVGPYGTVDPSNVFNLVGKHANAGGLSWGTPFDLADLANDPLVINGKVDLNRIVQIRVVDIPGNGAFKDSTGFEIYDAWQTMGSGGVDLEAVGIISSKITFADWTAQNGLTGANALPTADPDGDGIPNLLEYAFFRMPSRYDSQLPPTRITLDGGRASIHFSRDERAIDLTCDVQVSSDLKTWITIARSQNGQPFSGIGGYNPTITDLPTSPITSVGVIRDITVSDVQVSGSRRFLRVLVSQ